MEGPSKKSKTTIQGLALLEELITEDEERQLLSHIDASEWNTSLKRRTQHYGYEYNYTSKDALKPTTPIPEWCTFLIDRLDLSVRPDQMIVNEYNPGQGIAAHIDHPRVFGDTIVSVSLGSPVIMDMTLKRDGLHEEVTLPRRSALILKGDARYKWYHGIAARRSDHGVERQRRVSLTFRKMK